MIIKPSAKLYTSKYVGKNYVLFQLLIEDDQVIGGFINMQEELHDQFTLLLPNLKDKILKDLDSLWTYFVKDHYISILE